MYLDYMQMPKDEFQDALDKHANKRLFRKTNAGWAPTFEVQ
jgi:hypothetical protein